MKLFQPDQETKTLYDFLLPFATGDAGFLRKARLAFQLWLCSERTLRPAVDNGFGLCTGMANGINAEEPPLTAWLAQRIDEVAGVEGRGHPLTFADLWGAPIPQHLRTTMTRLDDRSIDFRAITTCVTFGRPFELPFAQHLFGFSPDEWSRLFPPRVLNHLVARGEALVEAAKERDGKPPTRARDGKLPLPQSQLPVVVAARMSLSFPLLFTMVPLWGFNYHLKDKPYDRVWFSDGGITSNFPVHRFDALYPRWPTLAINLQYMGKDGVPQRSNLEKGNLVYLTKRLGDATRDLWHPMGRDGKALDALATFGKGIFRSAQVWHDNAYLRLPGYRERIAEIWLSETEGGLNLDMNEDVVQALVKRGRQAGTALVERFDGPQDNPLSWDAHRWIRFRSGMAGLMKTLSGLKDSLEHGMPDDVALQQLLATVDAPQAHKFGAGQRAAAEQALKCLMDAVDAVQAMQVCGKPEQSPYSPFCDGPQPPVEIGGRAPF